MPLDVSGRIVLSASLNNILDSKNVSENVEEAEEALREYANIADQTQHFLSQRRGGFYLQAQQSQDDLEQVGNFQGSKRQKGKERVLRFSHNNKTVEFIFHRREYSFEEMIRELPKFRDFARILKEEIPKDLTRSAITGNENFRHPSEANLGGESRTLDVYALEQVDVVETVPISIRGISLPFSRKQRETVYKSKDQI